MSVTNVSNISEKKDKRGRKKGRRGEEILLIFWINVYVSMLRKS